jgi:hypothetical protein
MKNLEWAKSFVGCKLEGTGKRFQETVDVLVERLEACSQAVGIEMREDCLDDILRLISQCVKDCDDENGKFALRILGASIKDSGVKGFGTDPLPTNSLAVALARERLEEAKWWHSMSHRGGKKSRVCCLGCNRALDYEDELHRLERESADQLRGENRRWS